MIRHIVIWDVHGVDGKDPLEEAGRLRLLLLDMHGRIPSLGELEVGIQEGAVPRLVLLSEFGDREGLEEYRVHPVHQAVIPVLRRSTVKVAAADYEV